MTQTLICLAIMMTALIGCSGDDPVAPTPPPEPLRFGNYQPADVVVGQPDMSSLAANAGSAFPNGFGMGNPFGAPTVGNGRLYVPDLFQQRILVYDEIPESNGESADFAIGQPDLMSAGGGTSATKMGGMTQCLVAEGKLFVVDQTNNRVLVWSSPSASNVPADVVVGQRVFTSGGPATTAAGFDRPFAVAVGGGALFVVDTGHNRVMVWSEIPDTNGAAANLVIGQPDFATTDPGLSATALNTPEGIWSDGKRLAISDGGNRRVLIWNSIPTASGAPADIVIGAPDLVTAGSSTPSATSVGSPASIASDGTSLFIADPINSRVLIHAFPTESGAAATGILGQTSFTLGTGNDANQDGLSDGAASARTFAQAWGLTIVGRRLFVSDTLNSRVLIFNSR